MSLKLLRAIVQLDAVPRFGPARLQKLLSILESNDVTIDQLVEFSATDLVETLAFTPEQAKAFFSAEENSRSIANAMNSAKVRVVTRQDPDWPAIFERRLARQPTPWLWVMGSFEAFSQPAVGIGGSRDSTAETLAMTRNLAMALSNRGQVIISGGARGVDKEAHDAAISEGGRTILVLPQGVATWRPPREWENALERGQLTAVSEFAPTAAWGAYRAMQRNATMISLSDSFVITQSGTKGGTLNAGQTALKLRKPLFVVRQSDNDAQSFAGNERLIELGATPLPTSVTGSNTDEALRLILNPQVGQPPQQQSLDIC